MTNVLSEKRLKGQILEGLASDRLEPKISYTTGVPYYNVDFIEASICF